MGKKGSQCARKTALIVLFATVLVSCTHRVQIEASDKPFVVNLNVKIDHDIRVRVEDKNKDLLSLEDEVTQSRMPTTTQGTKGGSQ